MAVIFVVLLHAPNQIKSNQMDFHEDFVSSFSLLATPQHPGFFLGYFDLRHYNFRVLEICYYNSAIWKFVIIIVEVADNCHYGRIQRPWTHLQVLHAYCISVWTELLLWTKG